MTTAPRADMMIGIDFASTKGITIPFAACPQLICGIIKISSKSAIPIKLTKPIITFSILGYELLNKNQITKPAVKIAPTTIGNLKSICKAIAPPKISATAVEIEAKTPVPKTVLLSQGLRYWVAFSDKHFPVTIPKWATLCWRKANIIVDSVITQSNL